LNEKQYLQQKEQYKDHAKLNAQNISTVCLQNTNKLEVAQNVEEKSSSMFTNHFIANRIVRLGGN